jgi:tRNA dimethylallyltransferase
MSKKKNTVWLCLKNQNWSNFLSETDPDKRVLFLMGPTAIGKSALACALMERYPLFLINSDAALFYREMNIGTGKPSAAEQKGYPHALIDLCDLSITFSVSDFVRAAYHSMDAAFLENKIPTFVGGSMMYLKALQEGLSPLPPTDPKTRALISERYKREGLAALYRVLEKDDPDTANRLKPSDTQRILRALEVLEQSQKPMSVWLRESKRQACPYPISTMALIPADRAWLRARIQKRVEGMLKKGWVEECEYLRKKYHPLSAYTPLQAVGYKDIFAYLEGDFLQKDLVDRIVCSTAQLAKRQLTWLRAWPNLHRWIIEPTVASSRLFHAS